MSKTKEEEYLETLKAEGVEIEEEKEPEAEPEEKPEPEKEKPEPEKEVLPDDKPQKKRSIYDEYKDKKSELKSEREAKEKLEKDFADLQAKYAVLEKAKTPEQKQDALDAIDELATELNADPSALRKMREVFLKGVNNNLDESLKKDLEEWKSWKVANQKSIDAVAFENEFASITPALKAMFPSINDGEMKNIKGELDKMSHTKEWHDKDLEYVAFKNREVLQALVSPKKRGMESKGRKSEEHDGDFDFDIDADISSMTVAEQKMWQEQYEKTINSQSSRTPSGKIIL